MKRLAVLVTALVTALALAVPAGGQEADRFREVDSSRTTPAGDTSRIMALNEVIEVFVQLDVPSVAEYVADQTEKGKKPSKRQQRAQAAAVDAQQADVLPQLEAFGIELLSSMRVGANGFRVEVNRQDLTAIAALAPVRSVAPVTRFEADNDGSVPWVGSEALWDMGYTGEGISIGIIDTGIDYYHEDFGGSGDPADYAGDDPTIIEAGTFPTLKVVGGYDFTGDNYDASGLVGPTTPVPDDDPLDCNGHGSHVAGTAAGVGTTEIGPGVAFQADLYALKVFGCDGSTNVTSDAIEWALDPNGDGSMDDHLDVINMSLGSPFGSLNDPTTIASDNASRNGVIVVASAGNESGNAAYVTGSPGVAPGAISVAASHDGAITFPAFRVEDGSSVAGLYQALEGSIGPALRDVGPITGEVAVAVDGSADPTFLCSPAVNDLTGKIALVQRGECSFGIKHDNAAAAGAVAIIVYNDAARGDALVSMGFAVSTIPGIFTGNTAGSAIAAAIGSGETVNAYLEDGLEVATPELTDTLVDFSSRGPGGGNTFKPDLSAPGVNIRSAAVGTGTGSAVLSGTSMAAPHVAGMAALLREKYPDMSVDAIKSLLMNSTTPAASYEPIARQGVGVANVEAASELGAYTTPAGVSFGRVNPIKNEEMTRSVDVTSFDGNKKYDVEVVINTAAPGISVSAPAQLNVKEGQTRSFDLQLKVDPKKLPGDDGFFSHAEADGWVVLTDRMGGETLSVGFMVAVDPASDIQLSPNMKTVANKGHNLGILDGFTLVGEGDLIGGTVGAVGYRSIFEGVAEFAVAQTAPWDSYSNRETDIYVDLGNDGALDFVLFTVDDSWWFGGDPSGYALVVYLDFRTGDLFPVYYAVADYNDHVQVLPLPDVFMIDDDTESTEVYYEVVTFGAPGIDGVQVGVMDTAAQTAGAYVELDGFSTENLRIPAGDWLWLLPNDPVGEQFEITGG
ncbi:MAG: S8 family serine peptidase [Acidimicrobiia bacterium]|nr:S8 family serine peptidase [Acidimicrobiia bacterium]NNJ48306.1 S8 family serine peptidase [Acidimicrobiia bacterium]